MADGSAHMQNCLLLHKVDRNICYVMPWTYHDQKLKFFTFLIFYSSLLLELNIEDTIFHGAGSS